MQILEVFVDSSRNIPEFEARKHAYYGFSLTGSHEAHEWKKVIKSRYG